MYESLFDQLLRCCIQTQQIRMFDSHMHTHAHAQRKGGGGAGGGGGGVVWGETESRQRERVTNARATPTAAGLQELAKQQCER